MPVQKDLQHATLKFYICFSDMKLKGGRVYTKYKSYVTEVFREKNPSFSEINRNNHIILNINNSIQNNDIDMFFSNLDTLDFKDQELINCLYEVSNF
jgi:hypothetical protein